VQFRETCRLLKLAPLVSRDIGGAFLNSQPAQETIEMFATHAQRISAYGRSDPQSFANVVQFVILTIRQPLHRVPDDMLTAAQQDEAARDVLWGWKWEAYANAELDAERSWSYCEHVFADATLDNHARSVLMIEYLADQRGLGLAKAGFVVQLIYGLAGCLDSHNLARFGIKPRAFSNYKERSSKARRKLCERYVETVYELGGPETLWDSWCAYVAANQPENYRDADHVSALHCEALNI
jgi:hypothetical protein